MNSNLNVVPMEEVDIPSSSKYPYTVNIRTLDRGYLVEVGCKSFAFTSREELLDLLGKYLNDSQEIEKSFFSNKLFLNK